MEQCRAVELFLALMPEPFGAPELRGVFPDAPIEELEWTLEALLALGRLGQVTGGYSWRAM